MATTDFGKVEGCRSFSYQVIIVVTYDDGRLFPLTEDSPKCLLPIANRPLLSYQLDVIKQSGATEIYIVTPQEYHSQLTQFAAPYANELVIEVVPVADMIGSADCIRAVSDRIRGDFIVFNSDTLSQINLGELVHVHRIRSSDVTMLLSAVPLEESEKKGASATLKVRMYMITTSFFTFLPINLPPLLPPLCRLMRRTRSSLPSFPLAVS